MGLISSLLTLPVSGPFKGTLWLARRLEEAAEAERSSPAALRAALAELERRLDDGEIDEAAFEEAEAEILDRLEAGGAA